MKPNPNPVPEKEKGVVRKNRTVVRKNRTTESQSFNEGYLKALGDVEECIIAQEIKPDKTDDAYIQGVITGNNGGGLTIRQKLEELRKGR